MLSGIEPKVMDYDIAVAYFLEETNHLNIGQIPASVERILFDFETLPPLTSRQENLRTCALHILSTINPYRSTPGSTVPFALRYPSLKYLNILINEPAKHPRPIASDKAVVLVDMAGRLLLISLPPKRQTSSPTCTTGELEDISAEVRLIFNT